MDLAPALEYRDGWGIYDLNGIIIDKDFILKKPSEINPKDVLQIANTEARYQVMNKVGKENFLKELNAELIHEKDGYKLYHLTVEGIKIGPYLWMKDASSERTFLEGVGDVDKYDNVDPTIKTIEEALIWRAKKASKNLLTKFNLKLESEA
jgi:hypothetical protein